MGGRLGEPPEILGTYQSAIAHADDTIRSLDLDPPRRVPWCANSSMAYRKRAHSLNQEVHHEPWWEDDRSQLEAAARTVHSSEPRPSR